MPHSTAGYSHCTSASARAVGSTAPGAASPRPLPRSCTGPAAAPALVVGQPLQALTDPPVPQPGPTCVQPLGSWHQGKAPLPGASRTPAPSSAAPEESSPCQQASHVKGCPGWPLATTWDPACHHHAAHGRSCLAQLHYRPRVLQHKPTMACCREPWGRALLCTAQLPCTDSLAQRLGTWMTDSKGTNQLAPIKAEP